MKLEGLIASAVHAVQASDARLEGLIGSVVHAVAADARLEGLFGSVVHAIQAQDARIEGLIASVVHNDIPAPPSGGGSGGLQGNALQGINLEAWRLQGYPRQGE